MIRAKDLAAKLGVSAATVSLVLNNKPGICEETRRELRRKITEMGYGYMLSCQEGEDCCKRQSLPADERRERDFGFVVYPICKECGDSWAFYAAAMEGASSLFREKGYQMVVIHPEEDCSGEGGSTLARCLNGEYFRGLIVQKPCLSEENISELKSLGLPFVMVDTYYPEEELNCVSVNNEQGIYKLIDHLYRQGHTKIGYVYSSADRATFEERRCCYKMLIQRLGLELNEDWYFPIERLESLGDALKASRPTAFLTDNDSIAWQLIMGLKEMGFSVPRDIAVAGFEDRETSLLASPAITTVRVPDRELGRTAAGLLLSMADRDDPALSRTVKLELGVELVVRESTDYKRK